MLFYYYLLYGVIGLTSGLTAFNKHLTKFVAPFIIFVLFTFAALRDKDVDRDYYSYVEYFQRLTTSLEYFTIERMVVYEPAYFAIPYLSRLLSSSHFIHVTFAIFAICGVFVKIRSFKYSNSFFLS